MHTRAALLDFHERCHRSFAGLLHHCRGIEDEQLDRELDGFGYKTVREQLQHPIGAERYWISVILGAMDASEDPADAASIDSLEAFRRRTASTTRAHLESTTDAALNEPREMETFHGSSTLVPAHIVLRTQTHLFHHMGQIAAMCRQLGHPVPAGLDFPLG